MTGDKPTRNSSASTAKLVSERAGVSVSTVSRVLNDRAAAIPRETRERVLAAAAELRYRPNSLAQALRKGRTQTIGLIVPDIADLYFHHIARGVQDVAQAAGYLVVIASTDRLRDREQECVLLLTDKRVDGVIFAGGGMDDDVHLKDIRWNNTRVVTIGPHHLPFCSITVDDAGAVSAAVHHLAGISCQRVLCLAGQPNWLISQRRLAGYHQAVAETGLSADPALVRTGDFTDRSGERSIRETLRRGIDFDGIIAFNDFSAIGAMRVLAEAGLRVPDDVAVVGCDNTELSTVVHPTLTSIGFPQYEFGRTAARLLIDAPGDAGESLRFSYTLVPRQSTARTGTRSG